MTTQDTQDIDYFSIIINIITIFFTLIYFFARNDKNYLIFSYTIFMSIFNIAAIIFFPSYTVYSSIISHTVSIILYTSLTDKGMFPLIFITISYIMLIIKLNTHMTKINNQYGTHKTTKI